MSRNALHATVMSHPVGSAGGSSPHAENARMSASCTASSAVAKSAPRRTRTVKTRGTSSRTATSSTGSMAEVGWRCHEGSELQPFVDRLAARPGCGRQLTGELDRSFVAVDVDHHPSRYQVLRLGERAVGHGRPALAVVADPHAVGRQCLSVDELAAALEAT